LNEKFFFETSSFKEYENCDIVGVPAKYEFKPYAFGFQVSISPILRDGSKKLDRFIKSQ
jgi:hypothetical protein